MASQEPHDGERRLQCSDGLRVGARGSSSGSAVRGIACDLMRPNAAPFSVIPFHNALSRDARGLEAAGLIHRHGRLSIPNGRLHAPTLLARPRRAPLPCPSGEGRK